MTWFAIATKPSASRIAVRSHYNRGPRNGLHVFREPLASGELAIEYELAAHGFTAYLPVETRDLIHHRTKKLITRRFPLLAGYVFVENPHDWVSLQNLTCVIGALGSGGVPIVINQIDIDRLKEAEAANMESVERSRRARLEKSKQVTRRNAMKSFPVGIEVEINHPVIGRQFAKVTGTGRDNTVKAMAEFLGGLVPVEVPRDAVTAIESEDA